MPVFSRDINNVNFNMMEELMKPNIFHIYIVYQNSSRRYGSISRDRLIVDVTNKYGSITRDRLIVDVTNKSRLDLYQYFYIKQGKQVYLDNQNDFKAYRLKLLARTYVSTFLYAQAIIENLWIRLNIYTFLEVSNSVHVSDIAQ